MSLTMKRREPLQELVNRHLVTGSTDDARWREVFLLTANMLDNADDFLLLMNQRLKEFGRKHLLTFLNEVQSIVNPYTPHSDTASRSLVIHFLMDDSVNKSPVNAQSRYHSAAGQSRKVTEQIILVDPEIKKNWDYINFPFFQKSRLFQIGRPQFGSSFGRGRLVGVGPLSESHFLGFGVFKG